MYFIDYSASLSHHGVKGMKWGVRKDPERYAEKLKGKLNKKIATRQKYINKENDREAKRLYKAVETDKVKKKSRYLNSIDQKRAVSLNTAKGWEGYETYYNKKANKQADKFAKLSSVGNVSKRQFNKAIKTYNKGLKFASEAEFSKRMKETNIAMAKAYSNTAKQFVKTHKNLGYDIKATPMDRIVESYYINGYLYMKTDSGTNYKVTKKQT